MENKKLGLEEFKQQVKDIRKQKSGIKRPKLKEVAWTAFRAVIEDNKETVFNESFRDAFYIKFDSLMKLDNFQINEVVNRGLNKSYIYKKDETNY